MNQVGLWVNRSKPETQAMATQLTHWFSLRDWRVFTDWDSITKEKVDFLIALGGDGTLLEAAREAAPYSIPVLGVNFGRLGFLCEIERDDIYTALDKVIRNEYKIQERLMLEASVKKTGESEFNKISVLNDVVFLREGQDSLVTLQANLSGEPSVSYPADGLIIATPTG
ncbi:MAG: NAD(+)/NADH kinase, partial [Desulfitobacterium hafniense]|nr:NAD(+)/NADH kinase [Desulfitobacterium hafniense]